MAELTITKDNFEKEVMRSDKPVLLDFWAEWCGPCKMLAPIISEIAEQKAEKVKVGKINVDEQQELANSFKISAIPTVVVIKDGKVAGMSVGFRSKEQIEALL